MSELSLILGLRAGLYDWSQAPVIVKMLNIKSGKPFLTRISLSLSSISILPVFYVYSYPNETQPHTCCLAPCSVEFGVPFGEMAQALAQGYLWREAIVALKGCGISIGGGHIAVLFF